MDDVESIDCATGGCCNAAEQAPDCYFESSRRPVAYPRLVNGSRMRGWTRRAVTGQPVAAPPPRTLVAKLVDGPLAGSTRDLTAVEGRPPKTIDLDFGDRRVRYCLAEWEQSGHSATYGFLYEV
jgi:hypothetical protein